MANFEFKLRGFQYQIFIKAVFSSKLPEAISTNAILDTGCAITTIPLYTLINNNNISSSSVDKYIKGIISKYSLDKISSVDNKRDNIRLPKGFKVINYEGGNCVFGILLKFKSLTIDGYTIKNFYGIVPLNTNSKNILIGNDIVMSSSNISINRTGCIIEGFSESKYSNIDRGSYRELDTLFNDLSEELLITNLNDTINYNADDYSLSSIASSVRKNIDRNL